MFTNIYNGYNINMFCVDTRYTLISKYCLKTFDLGNKIKYKDLPYII